MDDIAGDLVAVSEYGEMLKTLENEDVAAVIARIKLDEELHIRVLKAEFERLC